MTVAKNKNRTKKQKKQKTEEEPLPVQPWISMRGGMIAVAITSVALAVLIASQTIPSVGWLEGILWGLLFAALIWIIFFGNLWITKKLRR